MSPSAGLYFHIPFCRQRCPYCDFNTYAVSKIPEEEYAAALLSELDYRASLPEWRGRRIRSIYFGGGTPSLLRSEIVSRIIQATRERFVIEPEAEITLEANPGTVDGDSLAGYAKAGINRLSLGAQSFNLDTLRALGRVHGPEQTEAAVSLARAAGIDNIGLDLIYGAPGQTLEQLEKDLKELKALDPGHVSAYGLTIEKGTPFYQRFKKGELPLPAEDEVLAMMETVQAFLPANGLRRYEISNFSKPGKEARHNMSYWSGSDYLGVGAGAHSLTLEREGDVRLSGRRWSNVSSFESYISSATSFGKAESWTETLYRKDLLFEFFFLGLRRIDGVDLTEFERAFCRNAESFYGSIIEVLTGEGLMERYGFNLRLSQRGLLLADSVIENFAKPSAAS